MPRPKTDVIWRERIRSLVQNNPRMGDKAIFRQFEQQGKAEGRDDYPAERTIRRYREEFLTLPEAQRRDYQFFSWPESMENGDLPWEAAPLALELLRHLQGVGRPFIRVTKWFWRVSLAVADAPIGERYRAARQMAALEALETLSSPETRTVEWFLAFAPWRSEANAAAYADAVNNKTVEEFVEQVTQTPNTPVDRVVEALESILGPGIPRPVVKAIVGRQRESRP